MSSHLLVEFHRLSIDCPRAMNEWLCRYVWVRQETQQLHGLRLSHLQEVVTWGRVATNLLSFLRGLLGPNWFIGLALHLDGFTFLLTCKLQVEEVLCGENCAWRHGSMFLPYDQLRRVCVTVYVIPFPTWGPSGWIHGNWPVLMKPKKTSKPRKHQTFRRKNKTNPRNTIQRVGLWKVGCKVFTSGFSSKHLSLVLACGKARNDNIISISDGQM